jgi:hypothetical protein
VVVTLLFMTQFPKMRTDTDPKNMLPATSAVRVWNDKVENDFSLYKDTIVLGIVSDKGILNSDTLDPFPGSVDRTEKEPATTLDNTQFALRAYREVGGFDESLYAYRGFFGQPAIMPNNPLSPTLLTFFFPKLSEYGASAQGNVLDGVLSLETG